MLIRVTILILMLLAPWTGFAQQKTNACSINLVSPQNGDRVSSEANATGSAKDLPPGTHVWIFAHRQGLALWWPQGGGAAQIRDGRWTVFVTYGQPRDMGSDFEVTAAVLGDRASAELDNWMTRAEHTGQYPGIPLPASVQGCLIGTVTVTRDR